MKLETDGDEYEILERAVESVKDVPGLILEIGTRKGGSMQIIIDSLLRSGQENRHVLSVDPYGHIPYNTGKPYGVTRFDYTNDMKKQAMADLFTYVQGKPVNFIPICLTDKTFIDIFEQIGWSVFDTKEVNYTRFAFAFLDGPHDTESVMMECEFIARYLNHRGYMVIDNYDYFDFEKVKSFLESKNINLISKGKQKASFYNDR